MKEEKNTIIQQKSLKQVKGIADIVFVLDRSCSMRSCIETVKDQIGNFIDALGSNQQLSSVDWRLGFVAFDSREFYILDFTNDKNRFKSTLSNIVGRADELTLPALDVALDFPWRRDAQRIIVLFTDEPLKQGVKVDIQLDKFDELKHKIADLSVKLYYFGKECPNYRRLLEKLPSSFYETMNLHTTGLKVDYGDVLIMMGKSLSKGLTERAKLMKDVEKDLYNVKNLVSIHKL